ncbi:hypothetical protein PR202_gb09122 [Eleusine coracana subsp. coracana]|uniref:F-box protein n=1 Tax=Eleusine coracana subsp. coracana TaxID=191504 RepID=A0AAV5EE29_ELECO|nr:hypothetical protein PR202_gb09122 [Eleusine coracana subsp. coracana]
MDDVDLGMVDVGNLYLAFDPTLSSHFEVLLIPKASASCHCTEMDPRVQELEWPSSPYMLHVFSTRTKQWEERPFVQGDEAVGTLTNLRPGYVNFLHNAVYWQGVLYVHCKNNFVMRISLSDAKYQIIKPPEDTDSDLYTDSNLYLGRSQRGIYCTLLENPHQIYILDESCGEMKWVANHHIQSFPGLVFQEIDGPWTLQDNNYHSCKDLDEWDSDNGEAIEERKFEWDSDNDNVMDTKVWKYLRLHAEVTFLGFHPYKDVVFLSHRITRGVAYHLHTGKVQDLGNLCPKHYGTGMGIEPFIEESFIYAPWMGEFPEDK